MVTIFNNKSQVVQSSRNMRGVMDRTRRLGASGLNIHIGHTLNCGGCMVSFQWSDDSFTSVHFASKTVATAWVNRPSFSVAYTHVTIDNEPLGQSVAV